MGHSLRLAAATLVAVIAVSPQLATAGCGDAHGRGSSSSYEPGYPHSPQGGIGALLGGVLGGVVGGQVGRGAGRAAGIVAGSLLGAAVGLDVGLVLDRADELRAQAVLDHNRTGETSEWEDPDASAHVSVTPTRTFQTTDQEYCREYTTYVTVSGDRQTAYGTACRQPDGSWKIVN